MRIAHLLKRFSFLSAAEHGRRFRANAFTAQVLTLQDASARPFRVGLTASRKTGNAVERNRIRRRLRAAVETAFQTGGPTATDMVIVARREVLFEPFDNLVLAIAEAPRRAKARVSSKPVKSHALNIPSPSLSGIKSQS